MVGWVGSLAVVLKVVFWCALAAEVAWIAFATTAYDLVFSVLEQRGMGLVHLLILGALALSSGLLVLIERRANIFIDPERYWTLSETLCLTVLFVSLFFGIYAFFGWFYSP